MKPVAWMVDGVFFTSLGAALNISFDIEQPCIPLYTHPVKELKLTKSEIEVLWEKHCPFDLTGGLAFARAILRKVQGDV